MLLEDLPTEIVRELFLHLRSVRSVLAFSATCHRLHSIYKSASRLDYLAQAVEREYGPSYDIIQLLTYNTSQPAHLTRDVAMSDALLKSMVDVGQVAARWETIYPLKKWQIDYQSRRSLQDHERYALRQALYRLWLFSLAFHNPGPLSTRFTRKILQAVSQRASLLHNYSTGELADMLDLHLVMRSVIADDICPSNSTIIHEFRDRNPGSTHQLLFNPHGDHRLHRSDALVDAHFESKYLTDHNTGALSDRAVHTRFVPTRWHEPGGEGWGDDVSHYYVLEDMLKLNPAQILHIHDTARFKRDVEQYVAEQGEWFVNNGETFYQSMAHVLTQRNFADGMEEMRLCLEDCLYGIAT